MRPTSLTCPSLSYPAKVPYVCQNVYVVCFFPPDLFPCLLSNEPRSPRGSEPKPHAIYTDRTAGALPAKAARDGGVGGWVEKLSWKLQVKPSVGNVSLFSFFLTLLFSSSSFVFLPRVPRGWLGQVVSSSGQLDCWTNITHPFESSPSSHPLQSFTSFFLYIYCSAADVFPVFSSLKHFVCLLPVKELRVLG